MKLQLKRSQVLVDNTAGAFVPQPPTSAAMFEGELALNYNAGDPALFIEDAAGNIIRIDGNTQTYSINLDGDELQLIHNGTGTNNPVVIATADLSGFDTSAMDLQGVTDNGDTTTNGATFGGNVQSTTYNVSSSSGSGYQLSSNGALTAQRSSGTAAVFRGYHGTSQNVTINADGSGSFAKDVKAGERDPSNDTDARGVRIAVDTVNGGVYTQCRGDSADPGALMAFQALVGDDERFVVKYDGSAEFAGDVEIGDFSSTEGNYLFESGGIYCKTSGTNQELLRLYEDSTINTRLFSDGRADFAGKVTINDPVNSEGVELYPDGRLFTRIDNIDDDKSVLGFYKNGYDEAAARVQFKADGSAEFAGDVNIAGGSSVTDSQGVTILGPSDASVRVRGVSNKAVFAGWQVGTSGNATSKINADGSASFAGDLKINEGTSEGVVKLNGIAASGGTGIHGSIQILGGGVTNSPEVFSIFDASATRVSFKGDGSATFAGKVVGQTIWGNNSTGAASYFVTSTTAESQASVSASNNAGGYLWRGDNGTDGTSTIKADGSATFAGIVQSGSADITSETAAGATLDYRGNILIQRPDGATSSDIYFSGYSGTTRTVRINGDGSASFTRNDTSAYPGTGSTLPSSAFTIRNSDQTTAETYSLMSFGASGSNGNNTYWYAGNGGTTNSYTSSRFVLGARTGSSEYTERLRITAQGKYEVNGDVQVGGDPQLGAEQGLKLWAQGQIDAARTSGTSSVFKGYTVGNGTPTVRIDADGSATFAGNVVSGPQTLTATTQYGYISPGYIEVRGDDDLCLGIFDRSDATANIELNADGSATFAGNVEIGDPTVGTSAGGTKAWNNGAFYLYTDNALGSSTNFRIYNPDASSATDTIISFANDGSASFSNTVQSPSFFGNNTGNSQVWVGGASTSIITADGSATFAGDITAGNVTFNTGADDPTNFDSEGVYTGPTLAVKDKLTDIISAFSTLKTAAAASTDHAELKAAIATALANF